MRDTLQAAIILEFKVFHDILIKAIALNYWCDSIDEAIKGFSIKHSFENLNYQEIYKEIATEHPDIFNEITNKWKRDINFIKSKIYFLLQKILKNKKIKILNNCL